MSGSESQTISPTGTALVGNPRRTRGLDEKMLESAAPVHALVGNPRRTRGLVEV